MAPHTNRSAATSGYKKGIVLKSSGEGRRGTLLPYRILVIAYHMLRNGVDFNDLGADYFDRMNTAKLKRYHLRRLAELGCDVSVLAAFADGSRG